MSALVLRLVALGAGIGTLCLFSAPIYGRPVWDSGWVIVGISVGFSIAYLLGLALANSRGTSLISISVPRAHVLTWGIVACLPAVLLTFTSGVERGLLVAVAGSLLVVGFLLLNQLRPRSRVSSVIVSLIPALAFVGALGASLRGDGWDTLKRVLTARMAEAPAVVGPSVEYVFSTLHDLRVTTHTLPARPGSTVGGSIAEIAPRQLLLVTGEGSLHLVNLDDAVLSARDTRAIVPMNAEAYRRDVPSPSVYFRVTDVMVRDPDLLSHRIFVAHHFWDSGRQCVGFSVSEMQVSVTDAAFSDAAWRNRFTTDRCMANEELTNRTGGRLEWLPSGSILLSEGDNHFNDLELASIRTGRIFAIADETGEVSVVSEGHRNPQGLLVDGDKIWATEHGPQGGDELNLIETGHDYGWPAGTYGTFYGKKTGYVSSAPPGSHAAGTRPFFAWVPSVGISDLISVRQALFELWKGDLLVASLRGNLGHGRSLFRVRIHDERVAYSERIETGLPIRGLIETSDGRLVLWDGLQSLQIVEPGDHVFASCGGCHGLYRDATGIGPDLRDIVGRPIASRSGYEYSGALRALGGQWTRERLDQFLSDPAGVAPGTKMQVPGIEDAKVRAQLIDYLETMGTFNYFNQ